MGLLLNIDNKFKKYLKISNLYIYTYDENNNQTSMFDNSMNHPLRKKKLKNDHINANKHNLIPNPIKLIEILHMKIYLIIYIRKASKIRQTMIVHQQGCLPCIP